MAIWWVLKIWIRKMAAMRRSGRCLINIRRRGPVSSSSQMIQRLALSILRDRWSCISRISSSPFSSRLIKSRYIAWSSTPPRQIQTRKHLATSLQRWTEGFTKWECYIWSVPSCLSSPRFWRLPILHQERQNSSIKLPYSFICIYS